MFELRIKIDNLRKLMYKKIEMNDYIIDDEIVSISQSLDEFIVKYEHLKRAKRYRFYQGEDARQFRTGKKPSFVM